LAGYLGDAGWEVVEGDPGDGAVCVLGWDHGAVVMGRGGMGRGMFLIL
jgi:hypothetical protein